MARKSYLMSPLRCPGMRILLQHAVSIRAGDMHSPYPVSALNRAGERWYRNHTAGTQDAAGMLP